MGRVYPSAKGGHKMAEKTEAQKKAQRAYVDRFAMVQIRMEKETHEAVKAHAEAHKESVNSFINRAIGETMERDESQ